VNLEALLDLAKRNGADLAEVYYSAARSRPVFFESNRLKQLESAQSAGAALRVWKNGSPGLAVAYGPVAPELLVEKALALSALNPPQDPLLAPPRRQNYPPLGKPVPIETLIEAGKSAIAQIRERYPEVLCSGELSCETETAQLLNSEGLDCQIEDTSISYYLGVEWIRGEDFLGVYDGEVQREGVNFSDIVATLLQRLEWAQHAASIPGGKYPVLFTPGAAGLFWDTVSAALNGKQIREGASPWSRKLGQFVVSPSLNLSQDPRQAPYDCPFDDEGLPTQVLTLINQGEIQSFYHDLTTAQDLGQTPTGNGFRGGLGQYPAPGLVNLLIAPGAESCERLVASMERGLIVDQLLGGGADLSGDFSVNVDLGFLVEGGKIQGRVKDTMIAGNVYELLNQELTLSQERRWQGSCLTPALLIDGVSTVS
jgi:PmbA protein